MDAEENTLDDRHAATDDGRQTRRRKWRNLFCPHCDQLVSKTTFYRHKRSYYNHSTKQWKTDREKALTNDLSTSSSDDDQDAPPTFTEGAEGTTKPRPS